MDGVSKAVELFRGGCACSQAILAAYGPRYGLSEPQALSLAAGFAAGMRMAETCGAVTGACMVLGLAKGGTDCNVVEGRQEVYDAVVAFSKAFRERQGSLTCRDLLGCDVSTPEGAAAAREAGLFQTRCVDYVRRAAELVEELLPQVSSTELGESVTPRELISAWVEAFNRRDAKALASLYSESAVNHQVADAPVAGRPAIFEKFKAEFAAAEMVCLVENIFEDGEWAILEWRDPLGLRGCGFFHVVNDQIVFQRGYWDKLSFLRAHNLPFPSGAAVSLSPEP